MAKRTLKKKIMVLANQKLLQEQSLEWQFSFSIDSTGSQEFYPQHLTTAVIGTGGWGELTHETEDFRSSEQAPKNAQTPSRPVLA